MTLQRSPKPESELSLEATVQLSFEQQVLVQLQSQTQKMGDLGREISTIRAANERLQPALERISYTLFGSTDEETPHGRLPRVESDLARLEKRLETDVASLARRLLLIENRRHEAVGQGRLISGVLGALGGGASNWLLSLLRK